MAGFMDKIYNLMGFEEVIEEEKTTLSQPQNETSFEGALARKKAPAPVVPINNAASQQKQHRVVILEPKHFDDAKAIADHLKNRRQVVVNLENADNALAQRVIDFVSGTTYALNGSMQKIGGGIFLFVPSNVDITTDSFETEESGKTSQVWQSLGIKG